MLKLVRGDGAVARLIIDRGEKKNAVSQAMWQALPALIADVERDYSIHALIVTGIGNVFASGADISEFQQVFANRVAAAAYLDDMARGQQALATCTKPTIAMIRGPCMGAGCGLALSCDIRFADQTAQFAITPAKLGMIYGLSDTKRLVDTVGLATASDILLSGRLVTAEEAARLGLINGLVDADYLDQAVQAFATSIADNSPTALRGIKSILSLIRQGVAEDTDVSRAQFLDALEGSDFADRIAAFLNRRAR